MSSTDGRLLVALLVLLGAACGGSSTPPPRAASPTPDPMEGGLRPLSSREGRAAPLAPGPGATAEGATLPPGHPPIGEMAGAPAAPTPSGKAVSGTISLTPELVARVEGSDVLYVMAKKDGATLAVQRVPSPAFPFSFRVSEGHAMVAGTTIEGSVDIVARLSKTGDAIPSPGDLEGATTGVAIPAQGIAVTIDHVRQ